MIMKCQCPGLEGTVVAPCARDITQEDGLCDSCREVRCWDGPIEEVRRRAREWTDRKLAEMRALAERVLSR